MPKSDDWKMRTFDQSSTRNKKPLSLTSCTLLQTFWLNFMHLYTHFLDPFLTWDFTHLFVYLMTQVALSLLKHMSLKSLLWYSIIWKHSFHSHFKIHNLCYLLFVIFASFYTLFKTLFSSKCNLVPYIRS